MRKAVIASRSGGGLVAGQRKCRPSYQRAGFAKNTLSLHLSSASSKRLTRILCAIVGAQPLLMQTRETNSTKRLSVRSEFVGDDNLRNEGLMSKQCPQQPHRGGLVALELDQDLGNLALAVDSTPHIPLPSSD